MSVIASTAYLRMNKILIASLFLFFASLGVSKEISQESAERLRNEDPKKAIDLYFTIRTNALFTTGQEPQDGMLDQARTELAKNPKLEGYLVDFFKSTPVYIENHGDRSFAASTLRELRTPWAAHMLGELLMKEEPLSTALPEDIGVEILMTHGASTNQGLASSALVGMKIPGFPQARSSPRLQEVQDWWLANRDQIEALLKGEAIAIDPYETGLAIAPPPRFRYPKPDEVELVKKTPSVARKELPGTSPKVATTSASSQVGNTSLRWFVLAAAVILLASLALWMKTLISRKVR